MKKNRTQKVEKAQVEHLMEAFPEPRGMPAEWHEHDIAAAKLKLATQAKHAETPVQKAAEPSKKIEIDAEKEAHLMEKFPKPQGMPDDWHCTHCYD